MSSTPRCIPVIVVGASEAIGTSVVQGIQPEYEVIHFTLASAIKTELPLLITNRVPEPKSSSIGSGNWAVPPRAIIYGGAFTLADIDELRASAAAVENARRIPWLRADVSLSTVSPPAPGVYKKEYSESILTRIKAVLARLRDEGKLDGDGDDELYPF